MATTIAGGATPQAPSGYDGLVTLFGDWRAFERPALRDGAPDYTAATLARKHAELATYQARLKAIDPRSWPVAEQVDYQLLRAEMNGFDFNFRVLQPWARDPAFYKAIWTEQSDTPAHEGPTNHAAVELWTHSFPLSGAAERKLTSELRAVPPLLTQARANLVGNARDLWMAGTGTMRKQITDLDGLAAKTATNGPELRSAIQAAQRATTDFVAWLDREAPSKTGPSGVGKENYTWSLRHVHLVPMTWDDEVMLLKRELARAHASLRMEEQRNRGLPPMTAIATPEEYERRCQQAVTKFMTFLAARDFMPIKPNMDPALRKQMASSCRKRNGTSSTSRCTTSR